MSRRKPKYFAAALLAAVLVTNDGTTSLGTPQGRLVGRIVVHGKPVGKTRACMHSLGCYYLPDKENRPGFGGYRGGPKASTWVTTNQDGVFHLDFPVVPQYRRGEERQEESQLLLNVSAWVPGKGASRPFGVVVERDRTTRVTFQLLSAGEVSGRVVDERGEPYDSVAVSLDAEDVRFLAYSPGWWMDGWTIETTSNRQGNFHFEGVVPGNYTLHAWREAGLHVVTPAQPGRVAVAAGQQATTVLLVIHDATLSGRVLDPQGRLTRDPKLQFNVRWGECDPPTPQDGTFEFRLGDALVHPMPHSGPPRLDKDLLLWVANWSSQVTEPGSRTKLAGAYQLDLSHPLPELVEIRLQPTGMLVLPVHETPPGRSPKSIDLQFHRPGSSWRLDSLGTWFYRQQLHLPCGSSATRHGMGEYWIEGVPKGEYEVRAATRSPGYQWATVAGNKRVIVEPGRKLRLDPLVFDTPTPPRLLKGRIRGASVLGGSLQLDFAPLGRGGHAATGRSLYIQDDSTFSIPWTEPGRFRGIVRVTCWNDGCQPPYILLASVSDVFEFDPTNTDSVLNVHLRPGSQLRVSVLDSFGDPANGCFVRLEPHDPALPIEPFTAPLTTAGDVKSGPLPAGRYVVSVLSGEDSTRVISLIVDLHSNDGMQEVSIQIPASTR